MARSTRSTSTRAPIRGYDNWTVGEMQKKLGRRSPDELKALLAYEKSTRSRKGAIDAIERVLSQSGEISRKSRGESSSRGSSSGSKTRGRKGASSNRSRGSSKTSGESEEQTTTSKKGGVSGLVESIQRRVSQALGSAPVGEFDRSVFMDRLSEFLEHERGGAKIYELGLEKVEDEEQRERIQEFLDQTHRHEEILTSVIQELGGHPDSLSESAELDRQKSEALLEVDAEGDVGRLNFFQNLFIAELTCHMNWEFLASCVRYCDDDEVRAVLEPHVSGIEDEEDEHVNWARKQLTECSMKMAFPSGSEEGEASSEEPKAQASDEDEEEGMGDEDMGEPS